LTIRQDESFGIVPLSNENGRWEVFLIKHKHGRYWGFPKGHAEREETPQLAAARELKEETNLNIVHFLSEKPLMEKYNFTLEGTRIYKRVYYFIAEVTGDVILQANEISDGMWLPLAAAMQKLTHPEGKTILSQVQISSPRLNLIVCFLSDNSL
jgi:8-oxo-dGTP pyrophosphatase MutT (NUDIX family)